MADPETALSIANFWIEASTAVVVVGVVIEFFDLLIFNKDMSKIQRRLLFVGALFVVMGCGGEFWFEHVASDAEAALQRQSDERVAALTRAEAADNRIATQAAVTAGRLGVSVGSLRKFVSRQEHQIDIQMGSFRAFAASEKHEAAVTIGQLNSERADLEAARSEARTAAASVSANLAQIKRQFHAREFTAAQLLSLTDGARGWGISNIFVYSVANDIESWNFASLISGAIKNGGVDVKQDSMPFTQTITGGGAADVIIWQNTSTPYLHKDDTIVAKIRDTLEAAGVSVLVENTCDTCCNGFAELAIYVVPKSPLMTQ